MKSYSSGYLDHLIKKLWKTHSLSVEEYRELIDDRTPDTASALQKLSSKERDLVYGKTVFIRGLIEISNYCKNDCLYCGIRRSNRKADRFRLSPNEILECMENGYKLGFRTFVMQGGEDAFYTDEVLCGLIRRAKKNYPDCAITLSLGERGETSFRLLREAGADRYLLRHESADPAHYAGLHPPDMSYDNRIENLHQLRALGFQTGCGFMVGSPGQTSQQLAMDLKLVEEFRPQMCGIGPFIPHRDTPFGDEPSGDVDLTIYLISILRLIDPHLLLPATTALGTMDENGRERAILAGANVIMPNLSPTQTRKKYELYNNKLSDGAEAAEGLENLKHRIKSIGYDIIEARGDYM